MHFRLLPDAFPHFCQEVFFCNPRRCRANATDPSWVDQGRAPPSWPARVQLDSETTSCAVSSSFWNRWVWAAYLVGMLVLYTGIASETDAFRTKVVIYTGIALAYDSFDHDEAF